jgi:hypothetical protein
MFRAVADRPLPEPDSEELYALVGPSTLRQLYGWLYRRRSSPPTMAEVRLFVADALGEPQNHSDRRLRDLRRYFVIPATLVEGSDPVYELQGWAANLTSDDSPISSRLRAEILASQRCAQCGQTPLVDGVKLVVDHKVPRSWGGGNERENLQPLCEQCNHGKRDYFQSYDADADKIKASINWDEPQRRIGELLLAFDGAWVRTDLLSIVASSKEFQEDWQRRLRDLRYLGWEIASEKRHNEGARVWTYYRVVKSTDWPLNIHAAIKAEEKRRALAKQEEKSADGV